MNNYICIGLSKKGNLIVNPNDLTVSLIPIVAENENFNKKIKKIGSNKTIYTVIGEIVYSKKYKSNMGYLVGCNNGTIDCYTDESFLELAKKHPITNFTLATKGDTSYVRKNPNVELLIFIDSEVKKLLGFSIDSLYLSDNMSETELEYAMSKRGFILGYEKVFEYKIYSDLKVCKQKIYFNKEGTLCIFNYIEGYGLNYFGNEAILMRHVNPDKYVRYLKLGVKACGSSNPIDGINTDITLYTYTQMRDINIVLKDVNKYSKPCKPYYISPKLDGYSTLLLVDPQQRDWCREYRANFKTSIFMRDNKEDYSFGFTIENYVGLKNILRYNPELQKFYSNYLKDPIGLLKKDSERFNKFSEKVFKKMIKDIDLAFEKGLL